MNLAACASKTPEVSDNQETVITSRTFTQANLDDEATCLERCGYEARGTMYSSCLETGETQQECGSSARLWYRECLQTRCDESALQLDDCRTDCRINAKEQVQQCDVDSIEESECKIQIQSVMRTCIDEC
tara:strand:- start:271 stop:660 length:390 start_codon:yes stop_codon:yes gene_type:complete